MGVAALDPSYDLSSKEVMGVAALDPSYDLSSKDVMGVAALDPSYGEDGSRDVSLGLGDA